MYKHYYKKNNLGKAEKITVIGRNVEKKLACYVKGHISEGDPITEKYYISSTEKDKRQVTKSFEKSLNIFNNII